jgi:hypothetical protein
VIFLCHSLKAHYLMIMVVTEPIHEVRACNANAHDSDLQYALLHAEPEKPIKRFTTRVSTKGISSGFAFQIASLASKKKIQMPGAARAGIGLLIAGALVVGLGQYFQRDSVSLYGLAMAIGGFVLYMASSIMARKRARP